MYVPDVFVPLARVHVTGALSPTVSVTESIVDSPSSPTVSSTGHEAASA